MGNSISPRILFGIFIAFFPTTFIFPQVIYVKHDASGLNDGSSWKNAYTDLSIAIFNSPDSSSLWISSGTYHPGEGTPTTSSFFSIGSNLSLFGGFVGNETSLEERNPAQFPTILSADINNDDIEGNFTTNRSDNTIHVVYIDSLLSGVTLDGLTIQGGNTKDNDNLPLFQRAGGGIYALSPVTIRNAVIKSNFSRNGGGVLLTNGSSHTSITGTVFHHNKTTSRGACIYALMISDLVISHCTFNENLTIRGAVYPNSCINVTIEECLFQDNQNTGFNGGAVFSFQNINLTISNCDFIRNSAMNGGAIVVNGSELAIGTLSHIRIEQCSFIENSAVDFGGGIYCFTNPDLSIRHCEFISNVSGSGGGVFIDQPLLNQTDTNSIRIDSCVFSNNHTGNVGGGALRMRFTNAKIENCTFDGNTTEGILDGGGGHVYQYCKNQTIIYRDVTFSHASSGGFAGAITCYGPGTHYLFDNCTFIDNKSARQGGAVHSGFAATVTYLNCRFEKNETTDGSGGAISLEDDSTSAHIVNSFLINNSAAANGGAIFSSGGSSNIFIDHCRLDSNSAITGFGGAIFISRLADDHMGSFTLNNSFVGLNMSKDQGGALNLVSIDSRITSCVFYENICTGLGIGGAMSFKATVQDTVEIHIINTTIVDNHGSFAGGLAQETESDAQLTTIIQNSIFRNLGSSNYTIEGGTPVLFSAGGNMSHDESMIEILTHPKDLNKVSPLFSDPLHFDYDLLYTSPGIDGGITENAPPLDILGNPRVNVPDMGAFESQIPVNTHESNSNNVDKMIVSPNPTGSHSVNVNVPIDFGNELEIMIIDLNGKIFYSWHYIRTIGAEQINLPVETLPIGIYLLYVSDESHMATNKLIRL